MIGTSPRAAQDYRAAVYPPGTILWMGGEKRGLSDEQQRRCDAVVRLPMVGEGDSLNLAVAAGVLLYEVFSRRNPPPCGTTDTAASGPRLPRER